MNIKSVLESINLARKAYDESKRKAHALFEENIKYHQEIIRAILPVKIGDRVKILRSGNIYVGRNNVGKTMEITDISLEKRYARSYMVVLYGRIILKSGKPGKITLSINYDDVEKIDG